MPYIEPFDETTPAEGSDISLGNDRIRELKRALDERLATGFGASWPSTDPLNLHEAKIVRGHEAGDDEVPASFELGALWQDPHTGILYVGTGGGRMAITAELGGVFSSGLEAAKPNPPVNQFWYSTDIDTLYVKDGATWVAIGGAKTFKSRYQYADNWGGTFTVTGLKAQYFQLNGPAPDSDTCWWNPRIPVGATIRRLRMWSFSQATGGAFARVDATLYKTDRGNLGVDPGTVIATLTNQSGTGAWQQTESAVLAQVVADTDILVLEAAMQVFAANNAGDARLAYIEIEYTL
jgi:hypothetical protein